MNSGGGKETALSARWVLGLNIGLHDASAALLKDGAIVAMGEQERFSRNKRANGEAPLDALNYCLAYAGIALKQLAAIAVGTDVDALIKWTEPTAEEMRQLSTLTDPRRILPSSLISNGHALPPVIQVRHHLAHAASALWASGMDSAAVLVIDNRGEDASTTLFSGDLNQFVEIERYPVADSLGLYYRAAAQYTGLCGHAREVGKLMGLAAYGRPVLPVPLQVVNDRPCFCRLPQTNGVRGGEIAPLRTKQLTDFFVQNCFPYVGGLKEEIMSYANFAASVQLSVEEAVLALCRRLKQHTGQRRLALAGGVALNCTANRVICQSGLFDEVFIQPVAHDAGVALGAALEVDCRLTGRNRDTANPIFDQYCGPEFSQEAIEECLRQNKLSFEHLGEEALAEKVAASIAQGEIVAWFQGRAEVGPRALGARSLLGDPRSRATLVRLNKMKSREMWRPLAPSVLAESYSTYFEDGRPSRYMIIASMVKLEQRYRIPAVTHVDGTVRPQVVEREVNPRFWKLLKAFERKTGIPMVVNTSFNIEAEPIVNSPQDAVRSFLASSADCLAIGDALVFAKQQK